MRGTPVSFRPSMMRRTHGSTRLAVVGRVQDAAPGIEELDRVHSGRDLHPQVVQDLGGELVQQLLQQLRAGCRAWP